jgi:hypothetical protein
MRFLGERTDGTIDKRRIRFAMDPNNYCAWLKHWRQTGLDEHLKEAEKRTSASYFLEYSGERLVGSDLIEEDLLLDDLYTELVDNTPDSDTWSIAKQADTVITRLGIMDRVQRKFRVSQPDDELFFDYRYDNGAIHLIQRVQLSFPDERSWQYLHAAVHNFDGLHGKEIEPGRAQNLVSLVKLRRTDPDLMKQVSLLEGRGSVIDISDEESAVSRLKAELHVN